MKKSDTLYVFDLDDTLLWSSEPYDEVTLDQNDYPQHRLRINKESILECYPESNIK